MGLAVVRSLSTAKRFQSPQMLEDFEQELVDQYALAMSAAGITDRYVRVIGARCSSSSGSWADRCGQPRPPTRTGI